MVAKQKGLQLVCDPVKIISIWLEMVCHLTFPVGFWLETDIEIIRQWLLPAVDSMRAAVNWAEPKRVENKLLCFLIDLTIAN